MGPLNSVYVAIFRNYFNMSNNLFCKYFTHLDKSTVVVRDSPNKGDQIKMKAGVFRIEKTKLDVPSFRPNVLHFELPLSHSDGSLKRAMYFKF